jgi:hypothetical protein
MRKVSVVQQSPTLSSPARRRLTASAVAVVAAATTFGSGAFGAIAAMAQVPADYHLAAFGDPMDFSNQEDLVTNVDEAMFTGATNKSISDGQLHFDAAGTGPFSFDPVWTGFPTGIPHGREGNRVPIDTNTYQRFVMRINTPEGMPLGVRWFNCPKMTTDCMGGMRIDTRPGWNTYDVVVASDGTSGGAAIPWSGQMTGLRVIGNGPGHVDVDWVRLVPAGTAEVSELVGGAPPDPAPTDRLDFATAAGNAWDMDALGDVQQQVKLASGSTVSGNRFNACNTVVNTGKEGDPGMVMNLPGGKLIDADRFKTLTFEYSYQGTFSAFTRPGGGMVARIFWFDGRGVRHATNGIHLYPNERVVQIRLDGPRVPFDGPNWEHDNGKTPWAGTVTAFRFDPNQDPGARCWTIGRMWLTSDDPAGTTISFPPGRPGLNAGFGGLAGANVPAKKAAKRSGSVKASAAAKGK